MIGLCFSCRKKSWIDSEAVATGVCWGRLVSTFCYSVWRFGSTCVASKCSARNGWRSSVQASTCSRWELVISIDRLLHTVLTHLHCIYSCFMFLHQAMLVLDLMKPKPIVELYRFWGSYCGTVATFLRNKICHPSSLKKLFRSISKIYQLEIYIIIFIIKFV